MVFLKSKRRPTRRFNGGPIGTEALAARNLQKNSKLFKYPEQGFLTRIEFSLLYSMICEPSIFPASSVISAIEKEELSQYLYVRPPPKSSLKEYPVSYAQLTALLVLAGEEWPARSKVPQELCTAIVKVVINYAEAHNLDRKVETEEVIKPIYKYCKKRGNKITMSTIVPIYLGGFCSLATANPIPFWVAYVASFAANARHVEKEAVSELNMEKMCDAMQRSQNVEHSSLLMEDGEDEDFL